ncbi:hypothetical protein CYLTODRAFT_491800 [Cylindrobasidium torrendii FP15055 ss-10]|uniref:Uncharacterized protein n=1 Tax=Cylindrobasidium torrendii FP15055 ss-10 TaxID=1314674 RepID=A0A0D7B669_9AGAR|nr:hypothetical protein CYLTODRAFT_491800 [Cylindrobasidium torrendii FP15055 ss-10]
MPAYTSRPSRHSRIGVDGAFQSPRMRTNRKTQAPLDASYSSARDTSEYQRDIASLLEECTIKEARIQELEALLSMKADECDTQRRSISLLEGENRSLQRANAQVTSDASLWFQTCQELQRNAEVAVEAVRSLLQGEDAEYACVDAVCRITDLVGIPLQERFESRAFSFRANMVAIYRALEHTKELQVPLVHTPKVAIQNHIVESSLPARHRRGLAHSVNGRGLKTVRSPLPYAYRAPAQGHDKPVSARTRLRKNMDQPANVDAEAESNPTTPSDVAVVCPIAGMFEALRLSEE